MESIHIYIYTQSIYIVCIYTYIHTVYPINNPRLLAPHPGAARSVANTVACFEAWPRHFSPRTGWFNDG